MNDVGANALLFVSEAYFWPCKITMMQILYFLYACIHSDVGICTANISYFDLIFLPFWKMFVN